MKLKRGQIIYCEAGFATVKSVRSLKQTLESLEPLKSARKKSKMIRSILKQTESSQSVSSIRKVPKIEEDLYDFDFNFGEVFLMLENLIKMSEVEYIVDSDGLIEVDFVSSGKGYISPRYVITR